jgi:hypothetical protein
LKRKIKRQYDVDQFATRDQPSHIYKHLIFTNLLPNATTIELGLPVQGVTIIDCLGPLSHTCKEVSAELIDWYIRAKAKLNYTTTTTFGAVDMDQIVFVLTIVHNKDHTPYSCHPNLQQTDECTINCPLRLIADLWKNHDIELIQNLKVVLLGFTEDAAVQGFGHDYNASALFLAKSQCLRKLRHLDIYLYRKFSQKSRDDLEHRWNSDDIVKQHIIPTRRHLGRLIKTVHSGDTRDLVRVVWYVPDIDYSSPDRTREIIKKAQKWREW